MYRCTSVYNFKLDKVQRAVRTVGGGVGRSIIQVPRKDRIENFGETTVHVVQRIIKSAGASQAPNLHSPATVKQRGS
jgi:hypothetical protein